MANLTPKQRIYWLILLQSGQDELGTEPTGQEIEECYSQREDEEP